jgi:hypothetical protein
MRGTRVLGHGFLLVGPGKQGRRALGLDTGEGSGRIEVLLQDQPGTGGQAGTQRHREACSPEERLGRPHPILGPEIHGFGEAPALDHRGALAVEDALGASRGA